MIQQVTYISENITTQSVKVCRTNNEPSQFSSGMFCTYYETNMSIPKSSPRERNTSDTRTFVPHEKIFVHISLKGLLSKCS